MSNDAFMMIHIILIFSNCLRKRIAWSVDYGTGNYASEPNFSPLDIFEVVFRHSFDDRTVEWYALKMYLSFDLFQLSIALGTDENRLIIA